MSVDEVINKIRVLAQGDALIDFDDLSAHDYFGGNLDDAYNMGIHDGRILLARDIISWLNDYEVIE